jgi:hypothetical protein
MPLHRDIHWIGRQWAVTGHGMQLIDQKLQGFFDIEVARLWDEILIESVHAKEWLNRADFDKGLALARARYPQSPGAETPPGQLTPLSAIESVAPLAPPAKLIESKPEIPKPVAAGLSKPASVEPPRAVAELKTPAMATRAPVEPPTAAVTRPRQAASPPAIEPVAPLPPVTKPGEAKRETLKLGVPEPVTVTLKHRPVEAPAAVTPPPQVASPRTVAPAARPSSLPPVAERSAPKPVVPTPVKPASVEPPRAALELKAPAIATRDSVEPPQPPSLFQMRYAGRARFIRPWRVVARKI